MLQILPEKTQKCFGRVKEKKPLPPRKRKCLVWRKIHGHRIDLSASSSRSIRSLGAVVSLQQILPEKTQKCFGIVKEKKPPPPRKRKCLVWR
ncbi:uncharacterized protein G2W53_014818 [Senna tora]|uniref:Uncharacterized protein n=1 Tax=Senna tora TaxID=362788 RepID=A0A835C6E0_9FABA|nr:uncharacterized protein G2W53_014818 [Senna tora]